MMKHIRNSLIICLAFIFVLVLTSCVNAVPGIPLDTPEVTISETGLASWKAVAKAAGYKYVIDNGAEQLTVATSVQLQDGQEIKVKAVADGDNTDSAYSAPVKYVAPVVTICVISICYSFNFDFLSILKLNTSCHC